MKKIKLPVILVGFLFLSACSLTPTQFPNSGSVPTALSTEVPAVPADINTPVSQPAEINLDDLKNMLVYAPELQKDVQLVDGQWTEAQPDGSIQTVNLDAHVAVGDLNSDGVDDAALLIAESMGGTGSFYSTVAMVNENGSFVPKGSIYVDDRPVIHSLEINNGEIILKANVHGPSDAMVEPTLNLTKTYRIYNGEVTLWRQTQLFNDGKIREINIESPLDNEEVSGTLTLKGNMPIAPFENNLLIQAFGAQSGANFQNGLMVSSEDMGMPAAIDTTVSLGMFHSGELVLIQLIEESMADGSPMAVDSVVVRMK